MSITVHPAHVDGTRVTGGHQQHVGDRYSRWIGYTEPGLTAEEKALAHEQFAAEFGALPGHLEPYEGWAETMAYLCRRIARRHRGEPVGEWVPSWQRRQARGGGHDAPLRHVS